MITNSNLTRRYHFLSCQSREMMNNLPSASVTCFTAYESRRGLLRGWLPG